MIEYIPLLNFSLAQFHADPKTLRAQDMKLTDEQRIKV
jgi:hypothetical protein